MVSHSRVGHPAGYSIPFAVPASANDSESWILSNLLRCYICYIGTLRDLRRARIGDNFEKVRNGSFAIIYEHRFASPVPGDHVERSRSPTSILNHVREE
jgi:hypothetical protein